MENIGFKGGKRKSNIEERPIKKDKKEAIEKTENTYSIDSLLDKAQECIDAFNYDTAQKFCQRALEIDANNVKALEVSGQLFLEIDDFENARKNFDQAVSILPDSGHVKYMYLGQLLEGEEAITYYQKGVEVMLKDKEKQIKQIADAANNIDKQSLISNRDISSAYLNIAEIYITDLCYTNEAETKCKENIDKALEIDPENAEAFQQLANFYLIKQETEKASEFLQKSLTFWLPKTRIAHSAKEENSGDSDSLQEVCPLNYDVRIKTCQLLTELEDYETAVEILEMLLEEDDEVIQTWYLLGWISFLKGDEFKSNARFYFRKAKLLTSKIECDDEKLLSHIDELLQELGDKSDDDNEQLDASSEVDGSEAETPSETEDITDH